METKRQKWKQKDKKGKLLQICGPYSYNQCMRQNICSTRNGVCRIVGLNMQM